MFAHALSVYDLRDNESACYVFLLLYHVSVRSEVRVGKASPEEKMCTYIVRTSDV